MLQIRLRHREIRFSSYFIGALFAPVLLVLSGLLNYAQLIDAIHGHLHLNPLGILLLFFSMVFMSIFLDTTGFFEFCARHALKYAGTSAIRLFLALYAVVSLLTIFTSNDIIILTLTPFIFYFARDAGIDPKPFLITEFFAANTWSMMLYIGNPTNIVIASAFSIRFGEFTGYLLLPTVAAGIANLLLLYLVFRTSLKTPLKRECTCDPDEALTDRGGAYMGLTVLIGCIAGLAIAPYAGVEMWQVSVVFVILLLALLAGKDILSGFNSPQYGKNNNSTVKATMYRLPWSIAPFVLSLFVTVEALKVYGITGAIGRLFASISAGSVLLNTFIYGFSSALSANLLNNIPMTIAFVPVMEGLQGSGLLAAAFATTIGSNLGANLTPLGSLAGIMWMSILSSKECRISFIEFIKYGAMITPITLAAALGTLYLEFQFF